MTFRVGRQELRNLARELHLPVRLDETLETLYRRCLERASTLADQMRAMEDSDPERRVWPWTGQ